RSAETPASPPLPRWLRPSAAANRGAGFNRCAGKNRISPTAARRARGREPEPRGTEMFSLLPKEEAFFEMFEKAADNAHRCTLALQEFLERWDDLDVRMRRVKELEHVGDEITHEVIERLNRSFITPIDREDIHELVCRIDDILDRIDTAVDRMCI